MTDERTEAARVFDTCMDYKFRQETNSTSICNNGDVNGLPITGLAVPVEPLITKSKVDGCSTAVCNNLDIPSVHTVGLVTLLDRENARKSVETFLDQIKTQECIYDAKVEDGAYAYQPNKPISRITLKSVITGGKSFAEFFKESESCADTKTWKAKPVALGEPNNHCQEVVYLRQETPHASSNIPSISQVSKGRLPPHHDFYKKESTPTSIYGDMMYCNRSCLERGWIDTEFERFLESMRPDFLSIYKTHIVYFLERNRDTNLDNYYDTKINLMKLDIGTGFTYEEYKID